jgi:hypothetical protein
MLLLPCSLLHEESQQQQQRLLLLLLLLLLQATLARACSAMGLASNSSSSL